MKKTIQILAYILLFAWINIPLFLTAQTTVTTYEPGISTEGVVYFLPQTAIDITVSIEKVTYTPGDLCKYADRYMRLTNISDIAEEHYELKGAKIKCTGVADKSKGFHIKFSTKSIAPNVVLSNEGTLLAINTEIASAEEAAQKIHTITGEEIDITPYLNEDMLAAGSKAKLAELVANEIYDIRDSKNALMRGESEYMPSDGAGLKLMVDNLQRQEDALMQLFSGVTVREELTQTIRFIPTGNTSRQIFARFSRKLGLVDTDNLAGSPIYIDAKSLGTNATVDGNETEGTEEMPAMNPTISKKGHSYDGVVYNIPAKAIIKVYTSNNTFAEEKVSIAQFGSMETLSSKLFSSKTTTKVLLDPITGALVKIEE